MIYNWFWCFISLITKVINRFLQFFYLYLNEYTKSILFYEIKLFQLYYVLHLLRITFLNIFSCLVYISISFFVQCYIRDWWHFFYLSRNWRFMSGSTYFDIFRFAELPHIFCLIRDNRNSIFNSQFDNRNYDAASHCTIDTVVSSIFLCVVCDLFLEYIFFYNFIFIICNIQSIHIYYYNSINIFITIIDNFS